MIIITCLNVFVCIILSFSRYYYKALFATRCYGVWIKGLFSSLNNNKS